MKRILLLVGALFLLISCTSELDQMINGSRSDKARQTTVFQASVEGCNMPETKVYADKNMKVLWNADDRISIFNMTTGNAQYAFTGDDGDTAGGFEWVSEADGGEDIDCVYAVYPYRESTAVSTSGVITVTLPAEQAYKVHSFGVGANTMVAVTDGTFLAFKNVGGYLSLRLYGDNISVRRITIRGNNGEKIAGQGTIEMPMGGTPTVTMDNAGTDAVSIVCDPAVKIGKSADSYTDFWFVIPPVTFTGGFTITVVDEMGGVFTKSTTKSFTVNRNTLDWMSALKVVPDYDNVNIEFEDANFKAYCVLNFDENGDGEISGSEVSDEKTVNVCTDNIKSIKGIEFFASLESLTCKGSKIGTKGPGDAYAGQLESIDVSKNVHLWELDCSGNKIEEVDVSNNPELQTLICNDNPIEVINLAPGQVIATLEAPEDSGIVYDWEDVIGPMSFPDPMFRAYVFDNFDTDKDGEISITEAEVVTKITCDNKSIKSLSGIECFTELTYLDCYSNQLTSLDVSHNTSLIILYCDYNQLTSLDVSHNTALTTLICSSNQFTSLDVSHNTALDSLICRFNKLTYLDVSDNAALSLLWCEDNQLTSLDVSHNTALTGLHCEYNHLTSLDVSHNTALNELVCHNNQLTSLDVSHNTALNNLSCRSNQLTSLDVRNNTALTSLNCSSNQLTSLDVSNNTALKSLYCSSNQLTSLDVSNNTALTALNCSSNQLTSLDVSHNTALANLYCSSNPLLIEIWLMTGQIIATFNYDTDVATIKYKDASGSEIICFEDAIFKAYCVENFDTDKDGEISIAEAEAVTMIRCVDKSIQSLSGIEYFTALTSLRCNSNQLTCLDVSHNTALTGLHCEYNQLTSLDVSHNTAMEELGCDFNQLTSLDVSHNIAMSSLSCDYNQLTSLDVSHNTALTVLSCGFNHLTSLDVSDNTALTTLLCCGNQLTSLDVSHNTALTVLDCSSNQLTSLDVSNTALTVLYCSSNQLTSLDVSNTALTELWCDSNPSLTEIWLKTGQTIQNFSYDTDVATIKYKD